MAQKSAGGTSDSKQQGSSSEDGDKASKVSPGNEKGPKLRLKSRKRNRYTEDPSPENKRLKQSSGELGKTPLHILVPETCDPDIIPVYQEGLPENVESEGFCHKEERVPDTEAVGKGTSTSDSESDMTHEVTGNRYSLRSSLFSPSSTDSDTVKSPKKKDEERSMKESLSNSANHDSANKSTILTDKKVKTSEEIISLGEKGDGYIQSSPIFQIYRKSNMESPDVNRKEACGDDDAESPLLLKVTRSTENQTSPAQTRLFDEDCISSPAANTSFKNFKNLSQGRRKGKLNQSKLTISQERKKKMEAGEDWLNASKPAAKDSPTMRQSTLSQVFMNMPSKPQPEKTETENIQKAIELSLKDVSHNPGRKSSETSDLKRIEKENISPFKRPLTPRKCKNNEQRQNSLKVKRRNKKSPSIDCDPDETVGPGSLNTGPTEASQGQMSMLPALNGSVDPGVQLSLLCDDSQSLKSDDLPDIDPDPVGDSSHVGNLTDFRIEDLRKSTNPLTSTCIDVDDPPGGEEEESQSIPCSMKFGGCRKRFIRIPENFSEEPGNNFQSLEEDGFIPKHEDSFDRVPSKEQPNFAHVDVVRKQDERRKLPAHKCDECREYYEGLGLSEEEIQKRMQTCSRHRAKHAAPGTPEHFWDIGMEDTLECEERGYVQTKDPDKEKPRFRRKRQLNKMF
ncbi:DNA endonuclease RBBP8-like [Saccostrea echinata]|uniref:DNA endonuclease RBBP8-like n=1 Tax=Saccostrea echinata TaxID=191078 RepID=UPI002A7EDD10|nr:DNA endonuclease RBBP8-like [Saccostrea echinata]